ncbi:MAG: GTP-binding protein [Chloroflexi bacterium AL-W]|nr:GTP-binding protein [Chloroflexi bacterium AL-N1]NOK65932.1 GTP-binding protein [Chloroflexi bacterium AL-N10]NOK72813.1 GTP-binding protein [Chloroflexi bacterium AL-N5]NOK79710.1 GTP-binding protein [Chloroflexi bacterium AL-W]NOK93035.1 GTP-binding protein [Chloroflexi bacterium AL-N15]
MTTWTIALAGNPNVGKSTVFNALTGARQHVGNWPGKTVEKKAGTLLIKSKHITVVDLPGTYSLSAYSLEEEIARDFIVLDRPHALINVVDAANLERNLYLTTQLLEIDRPLIMVVNMFDVAEARGLQIDTQRLSTLLNGAPVIPMVASQNCGIAELKTAIATMLKQHQRHVEPEMILV